MTKPYEVADAQRDDGSMSVADLISANEQGVADLRAAVLGMNSEKLRSRPIPGKWSTLEVVCHVSDGEPFFADRMKRTLAMDRPLLAGVGGLRLGIVRQVMHDGLETGELHGGDASSLALIFCRLMDHHLNVLSRLPRPETTAHPGTRRWDVERVPPWPRNGETGACGLAAVRCGRMMSACLGGVEVTKT